MYFLELAAQDLKRYKDKIKHKLLDEEKLAIRSLMAPSN